MLEIVVFLCGAVVMVLEMVGSRILAPYLGTSIVVWTSLIGVILGSLSLGYWWGGRIADRNPSRRVLALVILLAGLFIGLIIPSKTVVLGYLMRHAGTLHLGSTMAALLLFTPPSLLLGMVSPLAVRLKMSDLNYSGRTVGSLYAISTLGSILGTFFAGFYLIAFFGSTNILAVLAIVLGISSILTTLQDIVLKLGFVGCGIVALAASHAYDASLAARGMHDLDTEYNRILVYDMPYAADRAMRVMVTNPGGFQSAMFLGEGREADLALPYTEFYRLARHFKPDLESMLMLGGGGYSFPKYVMRDYPGVRMEVVEIDPGVTDIARRYFALRDDPRLTIRHEDARTFLNKAAGPYDAILVDTFNSHHSIPFHMTTVETVRRLHDLLADDGVVLANVLSAVEGDFGRFLRAEYATFKAVFPQVLLFPVTQPDEPETWQNVMLVAFKSAAPARLDSSDPEIAAMLAHRWTAPVPQDLPPLTDEFAPVDRYVTMLKVE